MTRDEWAASTDPGKMLLYLQQRVRGGWGADPVPLPEHALRLFATALCRQPEVWSRLTDPRSRRAVEVAELYALGEATADELSLATADATTEPLSPVHDLSTTASCEWLASWASHASFTPAVIDRILIRAKIAGLPPARQAQLLRCVCNPWPPVLGEACDGCDGTGKVYKGFLIDCTACSGTGTGTVAPAWLTDSLRRTAQAVHERRGGHGVLHDALIEAGCPETVACPACEGKIHIQTDNDPPYLERWERCDFWHKERGRKPVCNGTGRVPHPLLAHLRDEVHCPVGCWAVEMLRSEMTFHGIADAMAEQWGGLCQ